MPRKLTAVVPTSLVAPILTWLRNARDRRTLADMPDYLLKDIGLRRDQVEYIGHADVVREEPAAAARPAATVIALEAAKKRARKATPPEKPMAA